MSEIRIPVATGELLDKITILRIKSERIADPDKLANVRRELSLLEGIWAGIDAGDARVADCIDRLKEVNEALWEIEDRIRVKESRSNFDQDFIELARSVYFTNDKRAAIKREINDLTGSTLTEEKSYEEY
ncbi:hypothetical protein PC39_03852 [Salinisphaera sp. PC39]|uniref:DUF6165 family protein n=1 Tax=Salinisphaera sp. PC39 TaxID=1304156 RepID=UPI00333FA204